MTSGRPEGRGRREPGPSPGFRAALDAVRTAEGAGAAFGITELRVQLEAYATSVEQRLIASSGLASDAAGPVVAALTGAVETVEAVSTGVVGIESGGTPDSAALQSLSSRLLEIGPGA